MTPGKRPWALAAQAPKFEVVELGGTISGGGGGGGAGAFFCDRLASSVCPALCGGQPDSGEGCIVLQNGPARSLVAKFLLIQLSLACSECTGAYSLPKVDELIDHFTFLYFAS